MLRLLQHPVLLVLLCFSLIGTPVTYRGGAHDPHPHMFLEFLMDAEAGSFDHHHHGDADGAEATAHDTHDGHHDTDRDPEAPQLADPAERFGASLSAFVVGDVGQLAYILPEHLLPQVDRIDTASVSGVSALAGITHSPTAPPPR